MKKKIILSILSSSLLTVFPYANTEAQQLDIDSLVNVNNSNHIIMTKSTLTRAQEIQQIRAELETSEEKKVAIWIVGSDTFYKIDVSLEDLESVLPKDTTFVLINNKFVANGTVYVVNKNDILVNSKEEYTGLLKKSIDKIDKGVKIHAPFVISNDIRLTNMLRANGLTLGRILTMNVNKMPINTQYLGLFASHTGYFEPSRLVPVDIDKDVYQYYFPTAEEYRENDKKIVELIKKAKADENVSDGERVKRIVEYITTNVPYDLDAYNDPGMKLYIQGSSVLSVPTRNLAMCVGFSIGTARTLNMLGIPAYVIEGKVISGEGHAAIRAYFNHKWQTINVTSGGVTQLAPRLNNYGLYDVDGGTTPNVNPHENGVFKMSSKYEKWAKLQETSTLVHFNTDLIVNNRIPSVISEELKTHLINKFNTFINAIDEVKLPTDRTGQDIIDTIQNELRVSLKTMTLDDVEIGQYDAYMKEFDAQYKLYVNTLNYTHVRNSSLETKLSDMSADIKKAYEADKKRLQEQRLKNEETRLQLEKAKQQAEREREEAAKQAEIAKQQAEREEAARREQEEQARQAAEAARQAEIAKQQAKREEAARREQEEQARQAAEAARQAEIAKQQQTEKTQQQFERVEDQEKNHQIQKETVQNQVEEIKTTQRLKSENEITQKQLAEGTQISNTSESRSKNETTSAKESTKQAQINSIEHKQEVISTLEDDKKLTITEENEEGMSLSSKIGLTLTGLLASIGAFVAKRRKKDE